MDKIQYTQKLIEENIFERKKETIYKHDFSDELISQFDILFDELITPELNKICELQNTYSHGMKFAVKSDIIKTYIEKLYMLNCPSILKGNLLDQQFFLLYIISISFYRFNERFLNLSINEFINRIYFTNIVSICSKYFIQSRRTIFRIIKTIYKDIKDKSSITLDIYSELYHNNEVTIKNDIMQLFLTNILPKFNPLEIENIEDFYTVIFKRIFFFYLKSKTLLVNDIDLSPQLINQNEDTSNLLDPPSERYKIYEEAIYLAQIQQICNNSNTINTIDIEFNKLKKLLLPNEIQRLFLNQNSKSRSNLLSYKINLYRICSLNDCNIEQIKNKIPQVYRLLRSIHIVSSNSSFSNVNKQYMKDQFFIFLYDIFKDKLDLEIVKPILKTISDNLVESLTTGEFIDMVTLTQIDINGQKFIDQFKEFLKIVLNSAIVQEEIDNANVISS